VVGYYDKSKFPADLDGPLVGSGQAWYDEDNDVLGHQTTINKEFYCSCTIWWKDI